MYVCTYTCVYAYTCVCTYRERRRSCRNNRNPRFSNRSVKREKEKLIRTGVLPAVRHLTVTLSSRKLRRFCLVLLLISNECSSFVAVTSTATNLRVCASASFAFCIFPDRLSFLFFFLFFLFLSLSFSLSISHRNRPSSFSPFYF